MYEKRIVIIEDEDNIREICRRYLEREGYEVYTAENGEEGWNLFQQYQPDIIILDLMIPKKMVGNYVGKFDSTLMFLLLF